MEFILISTTLMVLMTIGTGIFMIYKNVEGNRKTLKKVLRTNLYVFLPILVATIITLVPGIINAETASTSSVSGFGFIAAALSTGLATVGAGYAVAVVGSSALGAVSEDPSILGKTLIFVGLAEGIAIYGLIVSILILGRL
ncbi:MAG TPA: ATPase [Tissierella sp.]|uniref:ATP synthase subunit C n=1 Tax=Tissierella TaxID=41273 RepID=UPI000EDDE199|nr:MULTISPECIES: ATP synthase subunit C [Tissierella]HAE91825.1 ATPase [Tissierella sp.]